MGIFDTIATTAKKTRAAIEMKGLDAATRRYHLAPKESLHGTLQWVTRAQDGTPDDGVSYGYTLGTGWTTSYPETTGYILQTFLKYYEQFGGEEVIARALRMARWEVHVQMANGATPGNFGSARVVPVAFNTGQVLLGWAEYLRRFPEDKNVRDAAAKAGCWLIECMGRQPWFEGGVSSKAEHGNLSYNSMVSWGLAELGDVLDDERFSRAAQTSALHYATLVDQRQWPSQCGFSDADSAFPLTHTLGYAIQGFIETGRVTRDEALLTIGQAVLDASRQVIDPVSGFLPGRVRPGWSGGTRWACLTGSAQFANCFLRLAQMGRARSDYVDLAVKLVGNVVRTQLPDECGRPELAWGVRGSFPFSASGYEPITQPNWAAKFLIDAEIFLYRAGRL